MNKTMWCKCPYISRTTLHGRSRFSRYRRRRRRRNSCKLTQAVTRHRCY